MFGYGNRKLSLRVSLRGEVVRALLAQVYARPDLEVEQLLQVFSIIIIGNSPIRAYHPWLRFLGLLSVLGRGHKIVGTE